jgi:hypothetical protein
MKTTATPEQIQQILDALAKCHVQPFTQKSGDPKLNAQRNLDGRTHYYDDGTLKWHHSRVLSSWDIADGLLFAGLCSDAADMHNTRRVYRVVVHDVFGTCVSRPDLEGSCSTSKAARNAHAREEFDLVNHYRTALASELKHAAERAAEFEDAVNLLAA